jgi:hypothetical protein
MKASGKRSWRPRPSMSRARTGYALPLMGLVLRCAPLRVVALCGWILAATTSPAAALTKGQQWFVDNGMQIMGLIGNPQRGLPFHLTTYQAMGYTTQLWEWATDPAQLTTSWGRWVGDSSQMPAVGGESSRMSTLRHLGLGDEPNLSDQAVRNAFVAWYGAAHANPTFNGVLLWNNNYGGQVNDAALGDFIVRARPDMISFDTYPYAPGSQPAGGSPTNWYGDLRRYRQHAMDTGTPLGVYRQTYSSPTGEPRTRAVSASELSFQTFAALAFNAKSLQDFTYNFNQTLFDPAQGGDNQITPLGTAAQAINAEAKRLGPALVRLRPIVDPTLPNWTSSIVFIRGKSANATTYNRVPIGFVADAQSPAYTDWVRGRNDPYMLEPTAATNLGTMNLGLPGDVIISWFRVLDEGMDGSWTDETYFMVTNALADMNGTPADMRQRVLLRFDFGASGVSQLQRIDRTTGLLEDVNLTPVATNHHLSLELDGGRGDLFKFKTGAPFVGFPPPPFARTSFGEPPLDTATFTPGPGNTELGFQTTWASSGGLDPLAGVVTSGSSPSSPIFTHRSVDAVTVFDTVDLVGHVDVSVSLLARVRNTTYEMGDLLRIHVTNDVDQIDLLNQSGAGLNALATLDYRTYSTMVPSDWTRAKLVITSVGNSSMGAEQYDFDEIQFSGTALSFQRGDSNGSDDGLDLSDAFHTLEFLFREGAAPRCLDAADANDDGSVNLSDAVFTLLFLFAGGSPPPHPFPGCGSDSTSDTLGCRSLGSCP